MKLFRTSLVNQLYATMIVIVFGLSVSIFLFNVRQTQLFLQDQLAVHSQDAADSLGLALLPYVKQKSFSRSEVEARINAIFDSGYYQTIRVLDRQEQPLLSRTNPIGQRAVPAWFRQMLPIESPVSVAMLNDGWRISGYVEVQFNPAPAYAHLWSYGVKNLLITLVAMALALLLGQRLINRFLLPLLTLEQHAEMAAKRQFVPIENLPKAAELRRVLTVFNQMLTSLDTQFRAQSELSEQLQQRVFVDEQTRLPNRNALVQQFSEERASPAYQALAVVQLIDFHRKQRAFGYEQTEQMLVQLVERITERCSDQATCYRLSAAEISVGLKLSSDSAVLQQQLSELLEELSASGGIFARLANAVIVTELGLAPLSALLALADSRLRQLLLRGAANQCELVVFDAGKPTSSFSQQLQEVRELIAERTIRLHFQPAVGASSNNLVALEVSVVPPLGCPLSTTELFAVAESAQLAGALDQLVIALLLERSNLLQSQIPRLSVKLSPSILGDLAQQSWLKQQLQASPTFAQKLVFELPEHCLANDAQPLIAFAQMCQQLGASVAICRFASSLVPLRYLQQLPLAYVKLDGALCQQVAEDEQKQLYLKVLVQLVSGLQLPIYAAQVEQIADQQQLYQLGLSAVQGYAIARPLPFSELQSRWLQG